MVKQIQNQTITATSSKEDSRHDSSHLEKVLSLISESIETNTEVDDDLENLFVIDNNYEVSPLAKGMGKKYEI